MVVGDCAWRIAAAAAVAAKGLDQREKRNRSFLAITLMALFLHCRASPGISAGVRRSPPRRRWRRSANACGRAWESARMYRTAQAAVRPDHPLRVRTEHRPGSAAANRTGSWRERWFGWRRFRGPAGGDAG